MSEKSFNELSDEEKIRFAVIENRPDLFKTKLLRISRTSETGEKKSILVSTRDPGSANALWPVLQELARDPGLQIDIITDGRAQEIIQKNFKTEDITPEDITPEGMVLEADKVIGTPDVILIDCSSETGIDTYVTATFQEVPIILVEDYYTNAIPFLEKLIKRNLPLPEKICVLDKAAKELIVEKFPQLEGIIEVTGQPAFDRFATENTEQIAAETKERLEAPDTKERLKPTDKLVSFMSTMDEPEKIRLMAEALKGMAGEFYFVFRPHPRDNTSYEIYKKILIDAGIRVIDTNLDTNPITTNDIGAASDVVLTTWSTEGLHGIYRRKPTVHIIDHNFGMPEDLPLPLPPVRLGASVGIDEVGKIADVLPQLLDPNSALNAELKKKMEEQYPADGKNAKRVADVVRQRFVKNLSKQLK